MKIYKKKNKIIIELDYWQTGEATYGEGKWKVKNLIGIIAKDGMTISYTIYLDYKDALQEGSPVLHFYGTKDDFKKLCEELEIDVREHLICDYCEEIICGCSTVGVKGNKCLKCEYM